MLDRMSGRFGRTRQAQETPRADTQPENQEAYVEQAAGEVADVAHTLLERSSADTLESIWDTEAVLEALRDARERYNLPEAYGPVIRERAKNRLQEATTQH